MRKLREFLSTYYYVILITVPIVTMLGCMTVGIAHGFSGKL
jgi:hypothetical protein